jgi:hypothetical protein
MDSLPSHILCLGAKIIVIEDDGSEIEVPGSPIFGGESVYRFRRSRNVSKRDLPRHVPEKSLLSSVKFQKDVRTFSYIDINGTKHSSPAPFGPWGESAEITTFLNNVQVVAQLSQNPRVILDFEDYHPHWVQIFGNGEFVHIRAKEEGKEYVEFIYRL